MKIVKIETFHIQPRWLFLRMETDDGFVGWGEPVVEGRAQTTQACIGELSEYLLGQDARQISYIWEMLYRGGFYRSGPILTSALSGIDQALWDIKGKYFDVPVYELLGGKVRDKVEVYSWIYGDTPGKAAKAALQKKKTGFHTVKMLGPGPLSWMPDHAQISQFLEKVQAVRDAVGPDFGIAIDFHGRPHKAEALVLLKELEPLHPLFVEEPVLVDNEDTFPKLKAQTSIPFATGERVYTRWGFRKLLQDGGVDIIQPDLCHAGGISEVFRIASTAETYDVAVAPHCPLGPIALASCLQIDFSCINSQLQEQSLGMDYNKGFEMPDYLENPEIFQYDKGYVNALTKPGLGVEVNEEIIRKNQVPDLHWKNPVFLQKDGSITEW